MFKSKNQASFEYFEKRVPYGTNVKLVHNALSELGWQNEPVQQVDIKALTRKILELVNKPVSDALEEQNLDHKHGLIY
jgi:hypothetical protein